MSFHVPDVLRECLDGGAEQLPGDVRGLDGEAKSLCFSPHHIIKLVPKKRDSQHRNSVIHCLEQAVLSTVGDKDTHLFVACGKREIEKTKLRRENTKSVWR